VSQLVVLGFDSRQQAEQVFGVVNEELTKQQLLKLEDSALVWREADGKVRIQQSLSTTGAGALGGAFWGTLVGLLFFAPVLGMAVGAGTGAVAGKLTDVGISDDMIKRIGETLQPGKAAVFALVLQATTDRVVEALRPYSPTVLQTNLTQENQEELVKLLQGGGGTKTTYAPAAGK
jgi:uncharacterized membrane protein